MHSNKHKLVLLIFTFILLLVYWFGFTPRLIPIFQPAEMHDQQKMWWSKPGHLANSIPVIMSNIQQVPAIQHLVTISKIASPGVRIRVNKDRNVKLHPSFVAPTSMQARNTPPSDKNRQKTRVIVLAYGRTGSSFFGGIFNANPDVFYIYEPLLTLQKFTNQSSDSYFNNVKEVLQSILKCNFTNGLFLKYLSKFHRHRAVSRPLVSPPFCNVSYQFAVNFAENRKWQTCVRNIDAHALNNVCRNKKHVVVKILAPRLENVDFSWLLHVSDPGSFPVRILYLVRDPRAMHFSRYKLGWLGRSRVNPLINGQADLEVKKVCNAIEKHLRKITPYIDVIQLVRYEDLVSSPEAYVKQLFSLLHLSPSDEVMRWLKERNQANHASKRSNHFSLFREAKTVLHSWRNDIPAKLLKIVEKRCGPIMKYFGYLPTNGSLTLLHNLQNPLFSKQWGKGLSVDVSGRHRTANRRP